MSVIPDRRRRRRAEVNIVPLVDVLTVLIFFFMVSMQFRPTDVLNVTLPEIETAGKNQIFPEQVEITITNDGAFFLNGQSMNLEQMGQYLRIHGMADRRIPVIVNADESTQLLNVTQVMDLCRKAGLDDFRLQAR